MECIEGNAMAMAKVILGVYVIVDLNNFSSNPFKPSVL
jgi:hypothetical protein